MLKSDQLSWILYFPSYLSEWISQNVTGNRIIERTVVDRAIRTQPQSLIIVRCQLPWRCNRIKTRYPNIPLSLINVTSERTSLTLAGGRWALWAAMLTRMHLHPPLGTWQIPVEFSSSSTPLLGHCKATLKDVKGEQHNVFGMCFKRTETRTRRKNSPAWKIPKNILHKSNNCLYFFFFPDFKKSVIQSQVFRKKVALKITSLAGICL